jgi:L-2-hydroxyglutarate oxidase LhgO
MLGAAADLRIVPFRGEYYELRPAVRVLVRGLIYPVPDPEYPFLGVHLTRDVRGGVHVGPNAVLALALEGYRWRDVSARDLGRLAAWPGLRKVARQHWRNGLREMRNSVSTRRFTAEVRRYLPDLTSSDLVRSAAGVRAQAVDRDGGLVDDFRISQAGPVTSVRNAPSPAATASMAIAEHIIAGLRLPSGNQER